MTDLAEVRAEGRRLVAEYRRVTESPREYYERLAAGSRWAKWVLLHADVLLADPAPVGLTDLSWVTEIKTVDAIDTTPVNAMMENPSWHLIHTGMGSGGQTTLTFGWGDRLSAAPVDDRERVDKWRTVPDGWEVRFDHDCEGTCWENVPASACPDRKPFLVPVSPSVDPEEKP